MPKKQKPPVPTRLQPWIDARRKFGLSHAHVQMARELGLNPKKLGKLDNCDQEPWKLPLRDFIVQLYRKRYGKDRPDTVRSIEEIAAAKRAKKLARKAGKTQMVATSASADEPLDHKMSTHSATASLRINCRDLGMPPASAVDPQRSLKEQS